MELDDLDPPSTATWCARTWCGTFSRQFPVPTYVVEFLLGRYCATTDESRNPGGAGHRPAQLSSRTVKAGEEELFKARARESGSVKIIDIITARLDAKTDSYVATLPSLR
jgi:ATP-dependent Lon protease